VGSHVLRNLSLRRKGFALHAISGVEIALWDIIGKCRNLPVYEMIGGLCRDKIKAYASLPGTRLRRMCPWPPVAVWGGIFSPQDPPARPESVKAVREAVGPGIVLMLDVNGAWTPPAGRGELQSAEGIWISLVGRADLAHG